MGVFDRPAHLVAKQTAVVKDNNRGLLNNDLNKTRHAK
jgi:hypothetical protein